MVWDVVVRAMQRGIRGRMSSWTIGWYSWRHFFSASTIMSLTINLPCSLEFVLHFDKFFITPSQTFTYLSVAFNTTVGIVKPTDVRLLCFITLRDFLISQTSTSAQRPAALMGQMEFLSLLILLGNIHKCPFQWVFRISWDQVVEP